MIKSTADYTAAGRRPGLKQLNKVKSFLRKPHNIILLFFLVTLSYLVVVPLISIVGDTFVVHNSELMRIKGSKVGDFTLYHWQKVLFDSGSANIFYKPLLNSLVCSIGPCFVAILVGGGFAWLVTRTDLRWKKQMATLFMFPYIMPSWTLALAWMNFFKNSTVGGATGIFTAITGLQTPNWFAYGAFPIIIVTGLHYSPFAYILIGGILRNMDANLEEAAVILKTSRKRMMWKITVPMVMPAVLSTFILTFSSAMSSFAVPSFLGLPTRYYVLTTQLYRTLNGMNPGYGYIIALIMIGISIVIMLINQKAIGKRKSYTTVTGKSANISLFNLKKWRNPLSIFCMVFVLCVSLIPMISFALQSVIKVQGDYSLANMTLDFWIGAGGGANEVSDKAGILINPDVWKGLLNSLKLSVVAALGAGTAGFLAGYAIVRRRGSKLSAVVENLTFIPYLIPAMAFSAIYLSMFAVKRGPIPALYGTFTLLVLIGCVKYMPMASRSGVNSMLQVSAQIEEAAQIMGIGWFKRRTQIIVPIQKSTVISGYLLPFISCMRELSLFVLLVTPANKVLTTILFQYNEKGWDQYANAINLVIVLIVLLVNYIVNKLTGASIDKGIGG